MSLLVLTSLIFFIVWFLPALKQSQFASTFPTWLSFHLFFSPAVYSPSHSLLSIFFSVLFVFFSFCLLSSSLSFFVNFSFPFPMPCLVPCLLSSAFVSSHLSSLYFHCHRLLPSLNSYTLSLFLFLFTPLLPSLFLSSPLLILFCFCTIVTSLFPSVFCSPSLLRFPLILHIVTPLLFSSCLSHSNKANVAFGKIFVTAQSCEVYFKEVEIFFLLLLFSPRVATEQIFPVSVVSDDLRIYHLVAIDELHFSCSSVISPSGTTLTFGQNIGIVFTGCYLLSVDNHCSGWWLSLLIVKSGERGQDDGKDCCKINEFSDWYAFDEAVLRSAKPQNAQNTMVMAVTCLQLNLCFCELFTLQ